jgi:hypothetical protein
MKIKKEYILKEVANQYVVVPTGKETINFNGMLTLNKTAKMLFEALAEDKEIEDLVSLLQEHYDLDYDQALIDVKDFIKVLESKQMIK